MIYGVGTDLIETERVLNACIKDSFRNKVFTETERREALHFKKRLAGDFVVKEAVVKAFGTGFRKIRPAEIEVLRDELEKPYVRLHGAAKEFAEQEGIRKIHVSISDSDQMTVAFAVAEC